MSFLTEAEAPVGATIIALWDATIGRLIGLLARIVSPEEVDEG